MTRLPLLALATLVAGSAAAQQPAPKQPSGKAEKPICKREAPIGSMIPTRKECHTRAEWDRMARDNRADAQADADRRVASSPNGY